MVAAYEQNDEWEKAFVLFIRAREKGIEPSDFMVSSVLSACAGIAILDLGKSVHACAEKACVTGNVYVGSTLVDMYSKCGSIEDAEQAFYDMPIWNVVSWNAMLGGYAHQGQGNKAVELFNEVMFGDYGVEPNHITFVCILAACSRAGLVETGMEILESMRMFGVDPGAEHYACVVDMLGRAGMVERAYSFILNMPMAPTVSSGELFWELVEFTGSLKLARWLLRSCFIWTLRILATMFCYQILSQLMEGGRKQQMLGWR